MFQGSSFAVDYLRFSFRGRKELKLKFSVSDALKHTHSKILPPPCVTVGRVFFGWYASPFFLLTLALSGQSSSFVSSDQRTRFQYGQSFSRLSLAYFSLQAHSQPSHDCRLSLTLDLYLHLGSCSGVFRHISHQFALQSLKASYFCQACSVLCGSL